MLVERDRANMRTDITKDDLERLYHGDKLNPYQIADVFGCDHKTVRAYLKRHQIQTRSASEYTYLAKTTHADPTVEALYSRLSVAAHVAYICEGWHTEKTNNLYFCNQDTALIDVFVKCVEEVYAYRGKIAIEIAYNKSNKYEIVDHYKTIYADRYVRESNDPTRKNPIIRVKVGGKNLARAFIDNAYTILRSFHAPNNTT